MKIRFLVLAAGISFPVAAFPWQPRGLPAQAASPSQQEPAPQNPADNPNDGQADAGSEPSQPSATDQEDDVLAGIRSVLEILSTPSLGVLGQAFGTTVKTPDEPADESAGVELVDMGDLDGDGVSEVVLKLLGAQGDQESTQEQPPPAPLRGYYLLAWDGSHWRASTLSPSARSLQVNAIRLGKAGRCLALVNVLGEEAYPFPVIYQVREHEASVLWDSQLGDNRYNALRHGHIEFADDPKLGLTAMIVTGQADPGLLQFDPGGHRGFAARCVYRWDGQAYVPAGRTEYAPGPDNSLYRFIAALHLHDFRSAYALLDPAKFLKTDAPSLEKFRQVIEQSWPEFLDNQVFQAREAAPGSPDALAFELPEKHSVYRPALSNDGKFLLTSLEREIETGPAGNAP